MPTKPRAPWSRHSCSVFDCQDGDKNLFVLPSGDSDKRNKWIQFIFNGTVPLAPGAYLFVCAKHFPPESFTNLGQYNAGFAEKLRLEKGVVPSIRGRTTAQPAATTSPVTERPKLVDVGCQTDPPTTRTHGTQLSKNDLELEPHFRSKELPQQHVCKEEEREVLLDQDLLNLKRNSSLDQEDPEPPQIKEEQEELCTSQEGEQLDLKPETDAFMLTPAYEGSDHTLDQEEPEPPQIKAEQEELCTSQEAEQLELKQETDTECCDQSLLVDPEQTQQSTAVEHPLDGFCIEWVKCDWTNSGPHSDHQLLSDVSDNEKMTKTVPKPKKKRNLERISPGTNSEPNPKKSCTNPEDPLGTF